MDILWIVLGLVVLLIGIVFSVLPILPGQIISWGSLLLLQLTSLKPFSTNFLVMWLVLALGVTALDYIVPIWGTKKFGGTKKGVWGSTIGLLVGIIFAPFGMVSIIIGPFVGAVIGEMIGGQQFQKALKSGFGSFIGFLTGTLMKLGISLFMGWYFVKNLVIYFQ